MRKDDLSRLRLPPVKADLHDAQFAREPFPRIDLSGRELTGISLLGADLRYADLRNARLFRVDLRLADLRGACLQGASFNMVEATCADFAHVKGRRWRMDHVNLLEANLSAADLGESMIRNCTLERADLSATNLADAFLVQSDCSDTRFGTASLSGATTVGSRFAGAELSSARQFFACREIVAEILLREAEGDLTRIMECAAVVAERTRCYSHWKAYLADHRGAEAFAFKVFESYPESGCREALRNI